MIVLPWAGVDGEPRVAAFVRLGKRSPPGSAPTLWLLRTTSGISEALNVGGRYSIKAAAWPRAIAVWVRGS